jgi:hypothetical protein
MAIITISRGAYSQGKEIAEKVAARLGYECVSREVLLRASQTFNIPEVKLIRAIHDAPSVLDRFTYGREKYLAFILSAFLQRARHDNMVYHGLAGHFMVNGVSHTLKVRILADLEDRVRVETEREKVSEDQALKVIKKDDEERRKWSLALWGKDPWDPALYDLIIHTRRITVDDAVEIICLTAGLDHFKSTPESRRVVDDLLLAAKARTEVVNAIPACKVSARDGIVFVEIKSELTEQAALTSQIQEMIGTLPGVSEVRVNVAPAGIWS